MLLGDFGIGAVPPLNAADRIGSYRMLGVVGAKWSTPGKLFTELSSVYVRSSLAA